jgi:hypothetical protein
VRKILDTTFRDGNPGAHMRNVGTSAARAQYLPSSASFRISLSSVSSDTAFFRRWVLPLKVLQAPRLIDLQPAYRPRHR